MNCFAKLVIPRNSYEAKIIMGDGTNLFEIIPITRCQVELKYDEIAQIHLTEMSVELLDGVDIEAIMDLEPLANLLRKQGYVVLDPTNEGTE